MKKLSVLVTLISICILPLNAQKFDDLAKTPPMGWNSWNKFSCNIDETIIKEVADAMVSNGMKDAGYEYIVIDDCWQIDRDKEGNIIADPKRFPSGMKALADYVHSKGLKFGLYSDAGTLTCQGRPGSRGYEFQDARTYASWGVDYLKYDWCSHGKQTTEPSYITMRDALYKAGRPIVFSICEWGKSKPWEWAGEVGHLWRTTSDIINCFDCNVYWGGIGVIQIIDLQTEIRKYSGPGHWNDPDMLEIGNGALSPDENKTHFAMWCMLSAPLMAGNDIRNMPKDIGDILTNKELININQDPKGIPALRWKVEGNIEMWIKPLVNNNYAICFLNRSTQPYELSYNLEGLSIGENDFDRVEYKIDKSYKMRDLWSHKNIGMVNDRIKYSIPGHGVLILKLYKE